MRNRRRAWIIRGLGLLLAGAAACATPQQSACLQANSVPAGEAVCGVNRVLTATPASLVFGGTNVGQSSMLTATLTNAGGASVTISGVSLSGAGIGVSGIFAGQILQPGQSAILHVTFAPPSVMTLTGSAVITSNASDSPTTISIFGVGRQPGAHSAILTWVPSVSTGAGYHVYSGTVSGGPYSRLTPLPIRVTTYQDSAVESGKTYHYVVTALGADGAESAFSDQVSATIP